MERKKFSVFFHENSFEIPGTNTKLEIIQLPQDIYNNTQLFIQNIPNETTQHCALSYYLKKMPVFTTVCRSFDRNRCPMFLKKHCLLSFDLNLTGFVTHYGK